MAKITFDEAEEAANVPLPTSEEEAEPSSSEASDPQQPNDHSEEQDSDVPEALSTATVKSALKDSNKVERLAREAFVFHSSLPNPDFFLYLKYYARSGLQRTT